MHWLVNTPSIDVIAEHPAVDAVIPFDRKGMGRALLRGRPGPLFSFVRQLRSTRYDIVLDAQGLGRSGFFAWITGAKRRIGHADAREFAWLGYTDRVKTPGKTHTVDRMLGLLKPLGVRAVGDLALCTPEDAVLGARKDTQLHGCPIVLAPTSIWPGKKWPIDRFVSLATRLHERGLGPIVAVGGPGEQEQCTPLRELDFVVDRVGTTSVGGLMATLAQASLVIANDSAALHIAVGFDRPIVALFGPTRTGLVGPYRREGDVIQHIKPGDTLDHKDESAGRALMERISVDEVEASAIARLNSETNAVIGSASGPS